MSHRRLGVGLLCLCACVPSAEPRLPDTAEPSVPVAVLQPSLCGESYETLDPASLGEIVEWEAAPEFSLSAAVLRGVADSAGLEGLEISSGIQAWRFRYTTQDRGRLVEATGLIGMPDGGTLEPVPVMLWHHHSMGFADACGPSGRMPEGLSQVLMAAFGYAVVAPDYLGMNGWGAPSEMLHPYIVAEPTAVASLDALRAFRRGQTDDSVPWSTQQTGETTVFMGGSEGGFATLWSHRLQPTYYPDVSLAAAVAFVPPVDVPAMVHEAVVEVRDVTSGVAAFLTAADRWYGQDVLSQILTDTEPNYYASSMEDGLTSSCEAFDIERPTMVEDLYTPAFVEAARSGEWRDLETIHCYLRENSLVDSTMMPSDAPVYLVAGEADTLVVGETVRDAIPALCDQGMLIRYRECAGAEHTEAVGQGLLDALDWLDATLQGGAPGPTCVVSPPEDCEGDVP